eukprot:scaffold803_cov367-Pavlova_lutheri.AAC.1
MPSNFPFLNTGCLTAPIMRVVHDKPWYLCKCGVSCNKVATCSRGYYSRGKHFHLGRTRQPR